MIESISQKLAQLVNQLCRARDRASYLVAGRARHEVGAQIIKKLAMRTRIYMAQGAGGMLEQRQIIITTNEVLECVAKVGRLRWQLGIG